MDESLTIDKNNNLPKAQDFNFLRSKGLNYIENLAGDVWTDYNTHDPGITLLEAMCYALTDLGYRTSFDVADILTSAGRLGADTWQQLFYTARQALPCNPLTLMDYRKLIIDTEGVRNAWIEISNDYEVLIYLQKLRDNATRQWSYDLTYDYKKGADVLHLRGLYKVFVEYEDEIWNDDKVPDVEKIIWQKLQFHRNLTEDFVSITSVEYEDFAIDAIIQVSEGTDVEMITAKIYKVIHDFFSPPVNFYSLAQMLEKNPSAEDVFNGPILNYGFIDSEELEKSERYQNIHLSDIINIISGIEGIIAVKKFAFTQDPDAAFSNFNDWISTIKDKQKKPRLDTKNSTIQFERSGDRHRDEDKKQVNKVRVNALYAFLKSGNFRTRLRDSGKDLPVPEGEFMDIADYYPFQKNLPAVYGMQETFINDSDIAGWNTTYKKNSMDMLDKSKKLVLQLRGFLMVFEQLLADYLSQLSRIRDIFSFNQNVVQTFYPQLLTEINDMEALFIDFHYYEEHHLNIIETPENFSNKRNEILDHLLSRFSESMDRYGYFMQQFAGKEAPAKLIGDKINFLNDYVQISSYRAKGYDYYAEPNQHWNSNNVEGLKKRICRLLGIANYRREHIAPRELFYEKITLDNNVTRYFVRLVDPGNRKEVLMESEELESEEEAVIILTYILEQGCDHSLYELVGKNDELQFELKRLTPENDYEAIAHSRYFDSSNERNETKEKVIRILNDFNGNENFHILDHILLRPKIGARKRANAIEEVALLPVEYVPETIGGIDTEVKEMRYKVKIVQTKDQSKKDKSTWTLSMEKNNEDFLEVPDNFSFYNELTRRVDRIREFASDDANYVKETTKDDAHIFKIIVGKTLLAQGKKHYAQKEDMEQDIEDLVQFLSYEFESVNAIVDYNNPVLYADPYSFQLSIILPSWQRRFRNSTFKHLLEKTIYLETPSHIYPHVYWVNHDQMREFDEAYEVWIKEISTTDIPATDKVNNLIGVLNKLRL